MMRISFLFLLVVACTRSGESTPAPAGTHAANQGLSVEGSSPVKVVPAMDGPSHKGAPPHPGTVKSPNTRCAVDSDCVLAFVDPCARRCPPCGSVWRSVSNRAAYRRYEQVWAKKVPRCVCRTTCAAPTRWFGTKALCEGGYCTVR